ncbi:hypothetical protein I6F30_29795 [Bradyrhizobium sp. NBAIM20]|uniref:hypothetical protein n=1 Tax=unclassified Bradyrhizobium TaxID=2631580 RepID=UPI001CD69816|nr:MULTISPECIES: hypothetical protein [unclassified Bradyrhizobium]MCA1415292.1 hypothetical protein [Bradyrhizobium sp. NBAIM20]MCA1461114.1 hypothetical protein [Bradyrhizobium sp. NBAIM18]
MRDTLRLVHNSNLHRANLPNAKLNHDRMLKRAVVVEAAHTALWSVAHPHMIATPVVTAQIAYTMLSVLLRSVGKVKNVETEALLASCIEMFDPVSDVVGKATGLWSSISKHPVILALAVRKLINTTAFTSAAELRSAMQEARNSILYLDADLQRWLELLRKCDRCVFAHDRLAWEAAYARVGADVARVMQDSDEEGYEDDDGEDVPPSPRWAALQAMIEARDEPSPG